MKIIYNVCKKTLMVALLAMLFQFTATIGMGEPLTVLADKSEETVKFRLSYHQIDDTLVTIPVGYHFMFDTTDSLPEGITLQDCITIGDTEIASFDGAYLTGYKEGKTTLHYRQGIKKGDLTIKVVQNLDIEATGQEAGLTDGKIKYHISLKNNSKSDVTIKGFNLGGSVGGTNFLGLPWVRQEVVLKSGETNDVSFLSDNPSPLTEEDLANHYTLPPAIYVKYEGAYFLISLKDFSSSGEQYLVSYYGTTTLEQYIKKVEESTTGGLIKKDEDNNEEAIKTVVVKSVKASAKRQLKVKWSKVSDVSGYQMQYALDKKFVKDSHTKNTKTTSVTIKKLKSERKYFIRVRCYKQSEGKKIYGEWSKPKSCMTK